MVGHIMIARDAVKQYPGKARYDGHKVKLKDADCHEVTVDPNQEVYHRKHGCFGIVTDELDRGSHWHWGHRRPGSRSVKSKQKAEEGSVFGSSDIYNF